MPEEKKGITADLTKVAENVYNDTLHRPKGRRDGR